MARVGDDIVPSPAHWRLACNLTTRSRGLSYPFDSVEKLVTKVRYDIVPSPAGWRISCNDAVGPAYAQQADAISDTLFIAARLRRAGHKVEVRVVEMDGPHRVWRTLEPSSTSAPHREVDQSTPPLKGEASWT
jgi:hypothetical protein